MSDCLFFPEDPDCQDPVPIEYSGSENTGNGVKVQTYIELDPMSGQIVYAMIAFGAITKSVIDLHYKSSEISSSGNNWWKYAH